MLEEPSPSVTTAVVQRCLEENELYLKAIVERQGLGLLEECLPYQEKLAANLTLLGSIADAQWQAGLEPPQE